MLQDVLLEEVLERSIAPLLVGEEANSPSEPPDSDFYEIVDEVVGRSGGFGETQFALVEDDLAVADQQEIVEEQQQS